MATKKKSAKSCGPQDLAEEQPSHSWPVERLGAYAQEQYSVIMTAERTLAPRYWRLGNALALARKNFGHGQWRPYLESLGIDPTRASKACAIFNAFSTAEDLESKTVEEAYEARRPRAEEITVVDPDDGLPLKLNSALTKLERFAEETLAAATGLSLVEKQELLESLRHTASCLQQHIGRLEREIDGIEERTV